ncbi:GntR family transcriptional regulator [Streptomyces sp. NPDC059783]|uniref:GntR family transcriptional regulator n=1 Tax=Streptomyces sp. NPDC059783 TaxID=3346944 RepID=UPI00364777C9
MSPRYEEIARDLRERITSGEYLPGTALPLMRDVAAQYGVSDITVRRAWQMLTREGLIESRRRAGMFVREHPDRVRLTVRTRQMERDELGYYSGPESQHWRAVPYPGGDETRVDSAPVPADVADALGVEPGAELTVRRRIVGDPAIPEHRQLADSWIAEWVTEELPSLAGDTGLGGMYDRLEEWAKRPLEWREEASARIPDPDEARNLLMPNTGVPILRVIRVTYFPARGRKPERIAEVQDIRMSAEIFSVGYPLSRGSTAKWPVAPASSDYYKASDSTKK